MKKLYFALVLAAGISVASNAPAATRNYDCSKAGNANKAVCKTAVKGASKAIAKSAPKAASNPKAAATKVSSTTTTKTTIERNYDCSKAGNKNKAVCKTAAASAAPVVKQTTTSIATRHYDCAKPGNASKTVCKTSVAQHQATAVRPAAPRSAPVAENRTAAGATGVCKDGFYSHSRVHTGACSHHGGVAKWL